MNTAIIKATTIITLVMLTAIGISGVLISTPLHASNGGNVVSVSQSSNSINGGNGGMRVNHANSLGDNTNGGTGVNVNGW